MTASVMVRVKAPHYCAGLWFTRDGLCVEAAPVLGWAVGKRWKELCAYFWRKGYEVLVYTGTRWRRPLL